MYSTRVQHIRRRKSGREFEAINVGDKDFEVCADTPDLSLGVGDVITFQEVDDQGKLTGKELTRKIIYRESLDDIRALLADAEQDDLNKHGVSVLGVAVPNYRLLKSVFGYAVTANFALDILNPQERQWTFVEGPFYAPAMAAPDLMDTGYLNGLHLHLWPIGRYSVTLLIRIAEAVVGKPLKVDVVDLMVLTIVKDESSDQMYGGFFFEELDPVAILDGKTINSDGRMVQPMDPKEIQEIIRKYESAEEATFRQEDDAYDTYGLPRDTEPGNDLPDLER